MTTIYKICEHEMWMRAERDGVFGDSAADNADGYIHFSTAAQAAATAAKHFAGMTGLVIVAVDADALGPALKWEPSRGRAPGRADPARRRRPARAAEVGGVEARSVTRVIRRPLPARPGQPSNEGKFAFFEKTTPCKVEIARLTGAMIPPAASASPIRHGCGCGARNGGGGACMPLPSPRPAQARRMLPSRGASIPARRRTRSAQGAPYGSPIDKRDSQPPTASGRPPRWRNQFWTNPRLPMAGDSLRKNTYTTRRR
jgi:uncharacterized protein (DUF952 family)